MTLFIVVGPLQKATADALIVALDAAEGLPVAPDAEDHRGRGYHVPCKELSVTSTWCLPRQHPTLLLWAYPITDAVAPAVASLRLAFPSTFGLLPAAAALDPSWVPSVPPKT